MSYDLPIYEPPANSQTFSANSYTAGCEKYPTDGAVRLPLPKSGFYGVVFDIAAGLLRDFYPKTRFYFVPAPSPVYVDKLDWSRSD